MELMMPRGHGSGEAEGIADGVDLLADEEVAGVGEGSGLEVGGARDLQQCEVVSGIAADAVAEYLCLSWRVTSTRLGVFDDVVVGEDMAFGVEDEAGALALLGDGAEEEVARRLRCR